MKNKEPVRRSRASHYRVIPKGELGNERVKKRPGEMLVPPTKPLHKSEISFSARDNGAQAYKLIAES